MKKKIIVAVDGPAGSGKSSVCKTVAIGKKLKYIDSGALYRSITWFCLQQNLNISGTAGLSELLSTIKLEQRFNADGTNSSFVNGEDVSVLIRDELIVRHIGAISDRIEVRGFVNGMLREWAAFDSVIMDGRDIGTVVFPDADVKIYLDASVDVRAARRMKEYTEIGKNVDENTIKNQIIQRDEQDLSRKYGALIRARDALYCDTSRMTQEEVVAYITEIIDKAFKL